MSEPVTPSPAGIAALWTGQQVVVLITYPWPDFDHQVVQWQTSNLLQYILNNLSLMPPIALPRHFEAPPVCFHNPLDNGPFAAFSCTPHMI
jgi:hypothetical protein